MEFSVLILKRFLKKAAATWLNVNAASLVLALPTIASAVLLMQRNQAVKNSQGFTPFLKKVSGNFHAQVPDANSAII